MKMKICHLDKSPKNRTNKYRNLVEAIRLKIVVGVYLIRRNVKFEVEQVIGIRKVHFACFR